MGKKTDFFLETVVAIFKLFTFLYDVCTFLPLYFYKDTSEKLSKQHAVKAVATKSDEHTVYRNVRRLDALSTTLWPECETVDDLFTRAVQLYGPTPCLGSRMLLNEEDEIQPDGKVFKKLILGDYDWETYDQVMARVVNIGAALSSIGLEPGTSICFFAETRAEWMIFLQACLRFNYPVVTLYATLGEDAVVCGINETRVTHVLTSEALLPKFKTILERTETVRGVIYIDSQNGGSLDRSGFRQDVQFYSMSSLEATGSSANHRGDILAKPNRSDTAVIMYTSGSTGNPKGVVITHGNLMCGMSGQCVPIESLGPDDTYIGYLPLAHVLELTAEISCLAHGARIGYSSPLTLSDQSSKIKKGTKGDASVLKPTLMAAVPVIMERLFKAVWDRVNTGGVLKKALFISAYSYKLKKLESGIPTPLCDKVVFEKVSSLLGGRLRLMFSGGAPLSAETQRFMNVCFCCPVMIGYGLTETSGAGCITLIDDLNTGRVGAPLHCCQLILRDWIEGGYRRSDYPNPRGELLIGGGNVAKCYYNNPKKTDEDFITINGVRYFCSGDIGEMQKDGTLKIIDRKKDLVKLQAGEYVSLGKLEMILKLCPLVDNCCIYADSRKNFTVCLVVPNPKQLALTAKKLKIDDTDFKSLCTNQLIEAELLKAVQKICVKEKLQRYEIPQKIKICTEIWTPETGMVTEALKLKRKNIEKHYISDIDRMYA